MHQQTAVDVPVLVVDLFVLRLKMLLQVGRVLSLQHRRAVPTVDRSHLADAHVRVGQVLEVFPDGAAAPPAHVLRTPAPVDAVAAGGDGGRRDAESVDLRVEALDVLLEVGRVLALEHGAAQPDVRVYLTDAFVALMDVVEERPNRTRSRPT